MSGVAVELSRSSASQSNAAIASPKRVLVDAHWWAGAILSCAGLIAVALQIGDAGLASAARTAPADPVFWLIFGSYYLLAPVGDWTIFRRIWSLPVTGLYPLVRKHISNELVFGYSGEAQFYLWARRHAGLESSPFGAVKDVAVLSAAAGNVVTLGLMAWNSELLAPIVDGSLGRAFTVSAGLIAASSLAMFLLRRRLFCLPATDLGVVFATHLVRIAASMVLLAVLCHILLPTLPMASLVVLATLRMMLSRLPFLPAKDVLFAGLVAILFGSGAAVVPVIAMLGSLVIATHVTVALCSVATGLVPGLAGMKKALDA